MFDAHAQSWREVYSAEGLHGLIYRRRMAMALEWVEQLRPPTGASALEVGSGAGLLTAELARRGLRVTSTDASSGMVDLTAEHVQRAGLQDAVSVRAADVHELPFTTGEFDIVIALGVLPWVHDARRAVTEMARVVRAGGVLVLSADNRWRLNSLLGDNPLLEPVKVIYHRLRPSRPRGTVHAALHAPPTVNRWLRSAGAVPVRRATLGFGPLQLAGRAVLPEATALRLHLRLEALADRGVPAIRWTGWHYLVAACKPAERSAPVPADQAVAEAGPVG